MINDKIKKYSDKKYVERYKEYINSEEYYINELFFLEMRRRSSIDNIEKIKIYILTRNNKEFIELHDEHLERDIMDILSKRISIEDEFKSSMISLDKIKSLYRYYIYI